MARYDPEQMPSGPFDGPAVVFAEEVQGPAILLEDVPVAEVVVSDERRAAARLDQQKRDERARLRKAIRGRVSCTRWR